MVARFGIYMLNLDSDVSREARNTRPCIVISPDEMNRHLETVIIAPISADGLGLPTRPPIELLGNPRHVILDQLRTVEKARLAKRIGEADEVTRKRILSTLGAMFAE
jgi:mRNA interferase MazF